MSQIWKKMKKSEMDAREKNFFRRKSFSFYAKKQLSKVEKNRDKININTRGKTLLSSCFFHVSPYVDFERNHRFGKKFRKRLMRVEKLNHFPREKRSSKLNHSPREKIGEKV